MDDELFDLRSSLEEIGLEFLFKKWLASRECRRFIVSVNQNYSCQDGVEFFPGWYNWETRCSETSA